MPQACLSQDAPAVDLMSLLERCLGNIDLVVRILARFHQTGGADLVQLEQAVDRSDLAAATELAHRFKGASGNVSAPRLYQLAVETERLGRERKRAELVLSLVQLRAEWEAFERYATTFVPSASAAESCARDSLGAAALFS